MNVELEVKKIISEQTGIHTDKIQNHEDLVKDLNADSMDTVEIVIELEHQFNLEISDDDAEQLKTVQQIIDYITART